MKIQLRVIINRLSV